MEHPNDCQRIDYKQLSYPFLFQFFILFRLLAGTQR